MKPATAPGTVGGQPPGRSVVLSHCMSPHTALLSLTERARSEPLLKSQGEHVDPKLCLDSSCSTMATHQPHGHFTTPWSWLCRCPTAWGLGELLLLYPSGAVEQGSQSPELSPELHIPGFAPCPPAQARTES